MSCPFLPNCKDLDPSQIDSSDNRNATQDKKNMDKQATRHRIRSAFHNSWGRKDSEHKTYKKNNSMVIELSSAPNNMLTWIMLLTNRFSRFIMILIMMH